ncbi:hypothetical protein E4T56_gene16117 [Termitomyces sp. T112]|nr:hypothetical protein E4T56_gene16117 [Termitomyces sp. T112]
MVVRDPEILCIKNDPPLEGIIISGRGLIYCHLTALSSVPGGAVNTSLSWTERHRSGQSLSPFENFGKPVVKLSAPPPPSDSQHLDSSRQLTNDARVIVPQPTLVNAGCGHKLKKEDMEVVSVQDSWIV